MGSAQHRKRLQALEGQANPGGYEVVYKNDWREDAPDYEAQLATARERVGPNGTVLIVEYVKDWRGGEHD